MDVSKATLVICITVFVVIVINAAIYSAFRRKDGTGAIDLFRKAASQARNPWENEDTQLQELSKKIEEIRRIEDQERNRN